MKTALELVVACTDRKALPARVRVRDLAPRPDGALDVHEWLRLLAEATPRAPARALYQGETWAASLELEATARRHRGSDSVRLWVASAGYGLVSADELLAPYAATFSSDSPDFVGGGHSGTECLEASRRWWRALSSRIDAGFPRSIAALAEEAPGDVLVVLSEAYLRACQPDVARAVGANERVVVVSPGAHHSPRLGHAAPAFDARLLTTAADRVLGRQRPIPRGTRMSLNVRTAQLLIERFQAGRIDRSAAGRYLGELTAAQPPLQRFGGEQHDDASVRSFIQELLRTDRQMSKTRALRAFRDAGNKCEQKRFGALYEQVRDETCPQEIA